MRFYKAYYFPVVGFVIDLITIFAGLALAYAVRFYFLDITGILEVTKGYDPRDYIFALIYALPSWLLGLYVFGMYAPVKNFFDIQFFKKIIKGILAGIAFVVTVKFFIRGPELSRVFPIITFFTTIFTVSLGRFVAERILILRRKVGKELTRLLIVGTGKTAQEIARRIEEFPRFGYRLMGLLKTDQENGSEGNSEKIIGSIDDFTKIIQEMRIDEVFLIGSSISHQQIMQLIIESEKHLVQCYYAPDLFETIISSTAVRDMDGIHLLGIKETPLQGLNLVVKRCFDILVSLLGLLFLAPFFLVLSIIIKLDSKGPIFYRQERIGIDGRNFQMLKFRSMVSDAEQGEKPGWTTPDDPRRTKIGAWMRKWNIDELPQLWNVLKGEMSLVGPRPERPYFVAQFKEEIPRYMSRHKVKSGMTGWAQVNGFRGDTSIEQRLKYDLYYIENWSVLFDIYIILRTFFTSSNAY